MAKKRRLSKTADPVETPTPETPNAEPQPDPEPQSEPQPEPQSEPEQEPNTTVRDDDDGDDDEEDGEQEYEQEQEQEQEQGQEQEQEQQQPTIKQEPDPTVDSPANGPDHDSKDPSAIQEILEVFSKDQLVELLRDTAATHRDVLDRVHRAANVDPAHRKVFVHGLGWDTTAETLAAFFRQYGEVEDCNAVVDKITGKSKGYGFILFKDRKGARRALKESQKKIGTRMTACQLAAAGPVPPPAPPVSEYTQRKIYVSNVGADLDPQKLMQFFSRYGEIEEGPMGLDKVTGKPRGFCLFVYKTPEGARKALEEPHKNFDGYVLHCQRAVDGPKQHKQGFRFQQGGGQYSQGSHFARNDGGSFVGNQVPAAGGHLMAPSGPGGMGYNQAAAQPAAAGLTPALGQALTALLASQGAGLGLTNLLGSLGPGASAVNQGVGAPMTNSGGHVMQGGYGNQGGGYGAGGQMQGGYGHAPMGQGGAGRGKQGFGHAGGGPYMGR